jgi:hypothetical protein
VIHFGLPSMLDTNAIHLHSQTSKAELMPGKTSNRCRSELSRWSTWLGVSQALA